MVKATFSNIDLSLSLRKRSQRVLAVPPLRRVVRFRQPLRRRTRRRPQLGPLLAANGAQRPVHALLDEIARIGRLPLNQLQPAQELRISPLLVQRAAGQERKRSAFDELVLRL